MLNRVTYYVALSLSASLLTPGSATHAEQDPAEWVGPWRYRFAVRVDPDSRVLANAPVGIKINFREMLRDHAINGRVDLNTIRVVRCNPKARTDPAYQPDADHDPIPHQLTGDFTNDDAGMVWWRVESSEDRYFHIYFDTDDHGRQVSRPAPGLIGVGDAFHYNDERPGFAGNIGLHSTYWHLDWDGDGLRDLIGFGLRTYEYGTPLEKELGNTVYFYKNTGASGRPLFAPPYRVKSEDGTYLHSDYLYQNFFPTDWDNDGDTDFFGFRANTLHLYENTGERDRNGLYLLKQPRPIAELQESDYREHDPNPLGERYWGLRGARYVDWEGDGDRDLIVALRTVNEIGKEEASRGIVPYGNGLQIFEVFEDIRVRVNDPPVFAKPFVLREERGILITAFGPAPGGPEVVDWDSDGDLDFLFHDLTNRPLMGGRLMFAENIGTRDKPLFVMPIPILFDRSYIEDELPSTTHGDLERR